MATKSSAVEKKRKASSTMKDKSTGKAKKARVEPKPAPTAADDDADSFDGLSDADEDGGVRLDDESSGDASSKKKGSSGKTFERG